MSEFALKQLEKYGWCKGKGLGKKENGITDPIKMCLKFNKHGIGHDDSNIMTSKWWCDLFNETVKNIHVVNSKDGVSISHGKVVPESSMSSAKKEIFVKGQEPNSEYLGKININANTIPSSKNLALRKRNKAKNKTSKKSCKVARRSHSKLLTQQIKSILK